MHVYICLYIFPSTAAANNPKPIPYKKIEKVKDVGIISASCGNHTTALLSKEGQLYMFGDLPISGITDEATGEDSLYAILYSSKYMYLLVKHEMLNREFSTCQDYRNR